MARRFSCSKAASAEACSMIYCLKFRVKLATWEIPIKPRKIPVGATSLPQVSPRNTCSHFDTISLVNFCPFPLTTGIAACSVSPLPRNCSSLAWCPRIRAPWMGADWRMWAMEERRDLELSNFFNNMIQCVERKIDLYLFERYTRYTKSVN